MTNLRTLPWGYRLALGVVWILALGASALAQRAQVTIDAVRFGWQGVMPADRFAPVRVVLSSGDKASSGVVQLEFDQDATQRGRITTAYATTPGLSTPVELTAALPAGARGIVITVIDLSGRSPEVVATRRIEGDFDGGPELVSDRAIIVTWGRSSISRALAPLAEAGGGSKSLPDIGLVRDSWNPNDPAPPDARFRRAQRLVVTPAEDVSGGVSAWSAYDGAELVVAGSMPEGRADPRTYDAVRAWVLSGGRLVIVAEPAGEGWRRWLPEGPAFDMVRLGEVRPLPGPPEVASALAALRATAEAPPPAPGPLERDEPVDAWHTQLRQLDTQAFEPAGTVRARAATPTERGLASGWRTRWSTGSEGPALIAEGPVGLGFVTLVGLDPELTLSSSTAPGLRAVWESAGATILEREGGWIRRPVSPSFIWAGGGGDTSFAGDPEQSAAVTSAIDRAVRGQGVRVDVGTGVFFGIAGCIVALALLLGPIDALVLKRLHARSLAWASALLWIALASAAGVMLPTLLRSGESSAGRYSEIDVLLEPTGEATPREQSSAALLAWDASVATIFAGRPERVALTDDSLGRVSRGVSAIVGMNRRSAFRSFAPHETFESSQGLEDPVAAALGLRTIRASRASELDVGQWMLRSVIDTGARGTDAGLGGNTPLRAVSRVVDTPDGPTLVLEISGLPATVKDQGAWIRLGPGPGRVAIPEVFFREGVLRLTLRGPHGEVDPQTRTSLGFSPAPARPGQAEVLAPAFQSEVTASDMTLWGGRARGLSHEARAASGRSAVVLLALTDVPMDLAPAARAEQEAGLVKRSATNIRTNRQARVRLSVPIPSGTDVLWSGSAR